MDIINVDYDGLIPNNVGLNQDERVKRALTDPAMRTDAVAAHPPRARQFEMPGQSPVRRK